MKRLPWVVGAMALIAIGSARAENEPFDLAKQCGACHALTKPTDTSLDRIWSRKGPDLWFAGDKFNQDWLVNWLQDPKPIRPAGYPYFKTVREGTDHDEVDPTKITPHLKLAKAEAEGAAAALMALKGPPDLVPAGTFKGSMSGARMGALSFTKLRGCIACHKGAEGKGGMSGPELTDAGVRLRPDFIAAYTINPQRFDPHVWMPIPKLKDTDVQRLTAYLVGLKGGDSK